MTDLETGNSVIPPKIPSPGWERARVRGIKKDELRRHFFMVEGVRRGMNIPVKTGIQFW
jgi:hypothetical protein